MATYQFSALSDGQAISFNPTADVLNFDQSAIAAADIRVTASGTNTRIEVIAGPHAGKDITLLNTTPFQLAMSNINFVDGSRLLFGDSSIATGDDNGNTLSGGTGRDLIFGFGGADTINIGTANYGGDHIDGGASFDTLNFGGFVTAALTIDFAAGTISSSGGNATFANIERVIAGTGNDSIAGAAGSQNLTSGAGNDTVWGAGGVDTLWTGIGADVLLFREVGTANADNVGDFTSGTDKIALDASVMTALGASGNLTAGDGRFWAAAGAIGGHDADDRVVYNTTTRQVFYDADGSGADSAQLLATLQSGATLVATDIVVQDGSAPQAINGTSGNDTLTGTNDNDTINGLGGNDSISGLEGADSLVGGDGNDTLSAGFRGGHGDGFIDTLDGGFGDDVYFVSDDGDTILADPGGLDTVILASSGEFTLTAGLENLHLIGAFSGSGIGNDLDNVIHGSSEAVSAYGMGGNDQVFVSGYQAAYANGGEGNDTLRASGAHGGTAEGGPGADSFVFNGPWGGTRIADFASGVDKIRLNAQEMTALGANGNFAAGDARFYAAAGATSGHDADDRVIYNTSTRELFYDPDGSGAQAAQLMGSLQAGATLVATDIAVDNANGDPTPGNDSFTGSSGSDTLIGLGGNDTLRGGGGDDFLDGGDGADSLDGSYADDRLLGGAGNDTLIGGSQADIFIFAEAPGSANADQIADFVSGVDKIRLDGSVMTNLGMAGTLSATDARFYAAGGATGGHDADDRLIYNTTMRQLFYDADGSGPGAPQLVATLQTGATLAAIDIEIASGRNGAVITGTAGNDSIAGTADDDTIDGLSGNDTLNGLEGDDLLNGGAGNDSLVSASGSDTLVGGFGDDTYLLLSIPIQVSISDAGGIDTVIVKGSYTLGAGLENLVLRDDYAVLGTGNELDNLIHNEDADSAFIDGADGSDTLVGGMNRDYFQFSAGTGSIGNDFVDGGGGEDGILAGGFSAVVIDYRTGTVTGGGIGGSGSITFVNVETAQGGAFDDRVIADDSGRHLYGGHGGNDTLIGGAGDDWVVVSNFASGRDVIDAGAGVDTLSAYGSGAVVDLAAGTLSVGPNNSATFAGIENFFGTDGHDQITGNNAANLLDGSWGDDTIDGAGGNDTLTGGEGSDSLYGAAGNDSLVGGNASDLLTGGEGDDTLWGAGRDDTLWGGSGADMFLFREAGDRDADDLGDFTSGSDKIALDGSVMTAGGASGDFVVGDARFWAAAGASVGHDADDRVIYNTTTRQIFYDEDGSGASVAQLIGTLQSGASLAATDIAVLGGSSSLEINGTPGNDSIVGTFNGDVIKGLGGNDTIDGQGGSDSLNGGEGNDLLSSRSDLGDRGHTLVGAAGDDTLDGWAFRTSPPTADTLDGGLGNDVFMIDWGDVVLDAGGVDKIVTRDIAWTLGAGFENLHINNDFSEMSSAGFGNELDNVMSLGWGGGRLEGRAGNDTLVAGNNASVLFGGDGDDSLSVNFKDDTLDGGAGNDTLDGNRGLGATLTGGPGADSFLFEVIAEGREITDFASGSDKIRLDTSPAAAAPATALGASGNFQAGDARFYAAAGATGGHDADDRVVYDTSTGKLYYDADGNGPEMAFLIATLQAGATLIATDIVVDNGTAGVVNGTAGNDSMTGTAGNDSIAGLAGNDTLRGLGGDDTLDGGEGIDSLDGGLGNDTYIVTAGDVIVSDPGGLDTVVTAVSWNISSTTVDNITMTGTANVSVEGNNLANVITGNDASNYINARGGSDTITGNGGNDTFNMSRGGTASFGNDSIDGGAGVDTVEFGVNALAGLNADLAAGFVEGGEAGGAGFSRILNIERFIAGDFDDMIGGSGVANYIDARAGNDTISSAGGADTLMGGTGNDRLAGGTGIDSMTGGAGLDSFVFGEAPGSANADRITDFVSASDKVLLDDAFHSGIGALGNFAAGDARFWAAAGATSGHDANDRVIYNTSTGSLYYDADGSGAGAAQLIATFTGNPAIAATDISVI